jgi:hypothetical protein
MDEELSPTFENENNPESVSKEFVDKLTLELFMNKNKYQKYISMTDPIKHDKIKYRLSLLDKYKYKILRLTEELLSSPNRMITNEVNDIFEAYTNILVRHFQQKELQDNVNDDIMFDPRNELPPPPPFSNFDEINTYGSSNIGSYWGKNKVKKMDI